MLHVHDDEIDAGRGGELRDHRATGEKDDAGDSVAARKRGAGTLRRITIVAEPVLEERLLGLEEGTRTSFELAQGEAFGERNPAMQQWVSRKLLDTLGDPDEHYHVGEAVEFATPDGSGSYAGVVVQVGNADSQDALLIDFNHPLAGQPVTFEVHVIGVL